MQYSRDDGHIISSTTDSHIKINTLAMDTDAKMENEQEKKFDSLKECDQKECNNSGDSELDYSDGQSNAVIELENEINK